MCSEHPFTVSLLQSCSLNYSGDTLCQTTFAVFFLSLRRAQTEELQCPSCALSKESPSQPTEVTSAEFSAPTPRAGAVPQQYQLKSTCTLERKPVEQQSFYLTRHCWVLGCPASRAGLDLSVLTGGSALAKCVPCCVPKPRASCLWAPAAAGD